MAPDKVVQQLPNGRSARLDLFLVADVGSEDGWDSDPCHPVAASVGNS